MNFGPTEMNVQLDGDDKIVLHVLYAWYPRLAAATPKQLRNCRIICDGAGLNWPDLDEDLSVRGLLRDVREVRQAREREPEPRFPMHWGQLRRGQKEAWTKLGCPRTVPWDFLRPHEQQALDNHSQSLHKLAERGGLGPAEMLAIVEGKSAREAGFFGAGPQDELAIPKLLEKLAAYEAAHAGKVQK